jgi:hypothetical protein
VILGRDSGKGGKGTSEVAAPPASALSAFPRRIRSPLIGKQEFALDEFFPH